MKVSKEAKVAIGIAALAAAEKAWEHRRQIADTVKDKLGPEFGELAHEAINAVEGFKRGWDQAGESKGQTARRSGTKAQRVKIEIDPDQAA